MIRKLCLASILLAGASAAASADSKRTASLETTSNLDVLIARHAAANNVPEDLVRRVIKRESGGNPRVISKGNYGIMQIRIGTARAMGYQGSVQGLLDADTNMTYAVKYLAGAYQAAGRSHERAVHYYAAGYYYAAKRQGMPNNAIGAFAAAAASGGKVEAVKDTAVGAPAAHKQQNDDADEAVAAGTARAEMANDIVTPAERPAETKKVVEAAAF